MRLHYNDDQLNLYRGLQTHGVFLFGALRALTQTEGSPAGGGEFSLVIKRYEGAR